VVRLGADRLVAILTEPPDPAPDAATILLLNSGSEPHVGPGRAWVTFARDLARAGHRAVRLDFRGWGESPPAPPGSVVEPYADHCRADLVTAVRALRDEGHARVVPFGLCSAAWVVLKVAVDEPLAGVIALNPQLYWERGQPHLLTYDENWEYRTPARARDVRGARWGAWTALDVLGVRPVAARWLDALVRTRTPVTLLFAAGDDGLHHLRMRLGRRFAAALRSPTVTLVEVADIDHSMYRLWRRPAIVAALDAALVAAGAEA
jgi:alpha-beta hydrolase superfamily lysophospholipase